MATVDDLAHNLASACANHIRFHNRTDTELLELRHSYWKQVAETVELLIHENVQACLKPPRKK